MPLQTEVPLALKDQLFAEYAECGEIQAVANKHDLSWSLVKRLHDHEEWDKRLALIRNEYAMAAANVAAKAAKQMVSIQAASAGKLYDAGTKLLDESVTSAESLADRAKAHVAATGELRASADIAKLVLDRVMPTSDGKPGVAVQVNVDARSGKLDVVTQAKIDAAIAALGDGGPGPVIDG